jgi:hypothetical protein
MMNFKENHVNLALDPSMLKDHRKVILHSYTQRVLSLKHAYYESYYYYYIPTKIRDALMKLLFDPIIIIE